jgi:hypothetical protein
VEVSDSEGVATHAGPESCGGGSNVTAEALTGVRSGQVLSREILFNFGVPTLWDSTEGNIGYIGIARYIRTLRGRRPCACTETLYTGTGRSHVCLWVEGNKGRIDKSEDVIQ